MSKIPNAFNADLVVIGAGSAGLSAAAGAAMLDLKVVLYEQHKMGGDCLNYGCVPSKALLSAAKVANEIRNASNYGVSASDVKVDWNKVKKHIQNAIQTIEPVDSQERFEGLGVTVIREAASFADYETIVSSSTKTRAKRIVVATGSRATVPSIPGIKVVPYLTNETIFSIEDLPEHLVILGGGPIGIEMAQAFVRLGSKVTVIDMAHVLPRADQKHAEIVAESLKKEGVTILENQSVEKVSGDSKTISVSLKGRKSPVTGSHFLVAAGRKAVLEELNLEAGQVAHDGTKITVSESLRSKSNPRVWALGDAAGKGQFTHLAGWHASVFIRRAYFKQSIQASSLPLPAVTYIQPEIAQIGLTEILAREKFRNISVSHFSFGENDRAIAEGKTNGEVKLVIHKGKVVGASILGEGAGDIVQLIAVAMSNGLKVQALTNFISPYPTRAEAVKRAASAHFTDIVFGARMKKLVSILNRIP